MSSVLRLELAIRVYGDLQTLPQTQISCKKNLIEQPRVIPRPIRTTKFGFLENHHRQHTEDSGTRNSFMWIYDFSTNLAQRLKSVIGEHDRDQARQECSCTSVCRKCNACPGMHSADIFQRESKAHYENDGSNFRTGNQYLNPSGRSHPDVVDRRHCCDGYCGPHLPGGDCEVVWLSMKRIRNVQGEYRKTLLEANRPDVIAPAI